MGIRIWAYISKLTHLGPMIHFQNKLLLFSFFLPLRSLFSGCIIHNRYQTREQRARRGYSNHGSYGCSSELHDITLTLFQLIPRPASLSRHSLPSSSGTPFSHPSIHSFRKYVFFSIQVSILIIPRASFLLLSTWGFNPNAF